MRVETNPTRETKNVSFRGSGHSSAKGRPSWVDRPPRGGETSRRRPLRRHRPGYRCKILLSGGGEQRGGGGGERKRERERDFNLHEAAVSSSGNYSAGLATREPRRGRHVRGKICSWRKRKRRSGRTMPRDWDCARESNRRNLFLVEIWPETRRDSNKGTLLYRILIRSRSKRWSRMEKESEKLFQISEQWSKTSEEALIKVGCLRGKK